MDSCKNVIFWLPLMARVQVEDYLQAVRGQIAVVNTLLQMLLRVISAILIVTTAKTTFSNISKLKRQRVYPARSALLTGGSILSSLAKVDCGLILGVIRTFYLTLLIQMELGVCIKWEAPVLPIVPMILVTENGEHKQIMPLACWAQMGLVTGSVLDYESNAI